MNSHAPDRANERGNVHGTERARPLPRSVVGARAPIRSQSNHLEWRKRIAQVISLATTFRTRQKWAAAASQDQSHLEACASVIQADRKTLRAIDMLFLDEDAFEEVVRALREWRGAIERGDL